MLEFFNATRVSILVYFQDVRRVQLLWRDCEDETAETDLPGVWPLVSSNLQL